MKGPAGRYGADLLVSMDRLRRVPGICVANGWTPACERPRWNLALPLADAGWLLNVGGKRHSISGNLPVVVAGR